MLSILFFFTFILTLRCLFNGAFFSLKYFEMQSGFLGCVDNVFVTYFLVNGCK